MVLYPAVSRARRPSRECRPASAARARERAAGQAARSGYPQAPTGPDRLLPDETAAAGVPRITSPQARNFPARPAPILSGITRREDRSSMTSSANARRGGGGNCAILPSMKELSTDERLRRLIGAADREFEAAPLVAAERGDALYRACLGARQILDARLDGEFVRFRQEPPAPDYAMLRARLNRRWREQRRT